MDVQAVTILLAGQLIHLLRCLFEFYRQGCLEKYPWASKADSPVVSSWARLGSDLLWQACSELQFFWTFK